MDIPQWIEKGSVFVVTTGSYSDYRVCALCRALVDIDVIGLRRLVEVKHLEDELSDPEAWVAFQVMKDRRMVEELPLTHLHLPDGRHSGEKMEELELSEWDRWL